MNFLHFYCLRRSKDPGYWEFKPWGRSSRLVLDSPSSLRKWKTNFFFVSSDNWEFTMGEDPTDSPKLLCCWGTPMFCASFYLFSLYAYKFSDGYGTDIYIYIYILFLKLSFVLIWRRGTITVLKGSKTTLRLLKTSTSSSFFSPFFFTF